MTEILIVCGALATLVVWMIVDAKLNGTKRHQPPQPDPMTEYIESMATRPERAGMEYEIRNLAGAQFDPWRGFEQPPLDVLDRDDIVEAVDRRETGTGMRAIG